MFRLPAVPFGTMLRKTALLLSAALILPVKAASRPHSHEKGGFTFAVMGCSHLGFCDAEDYESAIARIKESRPDFVLFLGGMVDVQGGRPAEASWREFDRITAALGIPVYNVPGDCRMLPLSVPAKEAAAEKKFFSERYKTPYYSFEHKNNLFIGLDSDNLPGNRSTPETEAQIKFLTKTLSDSRKYQNVFVFTHGSPWFDDDSSKWFQNTHLLLAGKVKYVFGAKNHYFDFKKIDGVTYVTSGFPPCAPKHYGKPSFPHFLTVWTDNKTVTVKVRAVKSIPMENLGIGEGDESARYPEHLNAQTAFETKNFILESPERLDILDPPRVVRTIGIKPDANILDIGAGTGLFTFLFADALKGSGRVYATDVSPRLTDYIGKQTKKAGYKNVFPVTVSSSGLDPFYTKNTFDVIFLSGVYDCILSPEDYFRQLRRSLTKGKGRLYIIHMKSVSDFSEMEFGDFRAAMEILKTKTENFPFLGRLSPENRHFLGTWEGEEIPAAIKTALTADFNSMLQDRTLANELSYYYAAAENAGRPALLEDFIDPLDVRLVRWLTISLDEKGVFGKTTTALKDADKRELRKLNRTLISGILHSDRLYWVTPRRTCVEKNSIISTMRAAGYRLTNEYDFLTHHYFLEFE